MIFVSWDSCQHFLGLSSAIDLEREEEVSLHCSKKIFG